MNDRVLQSPSGTSHWQSALTETVGRSTRNHDAEPFVQVDSHLGTGVCRLKAVMTGSSAMGETASLVGRALSPLARTPAQHRCRGRSQEASQRPRDPVVPILDRGGHRCREVLRHLDALRGYDGVGLRLHGGRRRSLPRQTGDDRSTVRCHGRAALWLDRG